MDTPKMETIELSCTTGTDSQHKAASDKHDREANSTGELLASHSCDECQEQELNKPDLVNVFWRVKQVDRSKLMIPPLNFAMVNKGVYRSGYPNKRNFYFLKTLGLKSILYLSPEKHEELKIGRQNIQFIEENNLDLFHIGISGQKEPFQVTSETDFARALRVVLDKRNHPILIHCDKGKHRTGCMYVDGCVYQVYCNTCGYFSCKLMETVAPWVLNLMDNNSLIHEYIRLHVYERNRAGHWLQRSMNILGFVKEAQGF